MKEESPLITRRKKLSTSNRQKPINGKPKIIGKVEYHRKFYSKTLNNRRDIIVWLPPSYKKEKQRRYPVLYMHDGQNIMDPRTAYIGVDWQVDENISRLIKSGDLQEIIVVGIYNTPERLEEYSDSVKGKNYMKFMVEQLKPFIDKYYRTMLEQRIHCDNGLIDGRVNFISACMELSRCIWKSRMHVKLVLL